MRKGRHRTGVRPTPSLAPRKQPRTSDSRSLRSLHSPFGSHPPPPDSSGTTRREPGGASRPPSFQLASARTDQCPPHRHRPAAPEAASLMLSLPPSPSIPPDPPAPSPPPLPSPSPPLP